MNPLVLVVARDPAVRSQLSRLLAQQGYRVEAVGNRSQAFDLLDSTSPELLVLDDPAEDRTYRLVWLHEEDQPDVRVSLFELDDLLLAEQLGSVALRGRYADPSLPEGPRACAG